MPAIRYIKPFIFANGYFDVDDNVDYESIFFRLFTFQILVFYMFTLFLL